MAFSLAVIVFISLCLKVLVALDSCDVDGSVRLDNHSQVITFLSGNKYKFLQVCLFGHWSYVCNTLFDHNAADRDVALYQVGCANGFTWRFEQNKLPVYLNLIACSGAERRLIECNHYSLLNLTNDLCNHKVIVRVPCIAPINRTCQNGELLLNSTTNVLYICIKDQWRTLCSNLIGTTQAHVACRQLNPGKTIISATVTANSETSADSFRSLIFCTGRERNLTDCDLSPVGSSIACSTNKVAGVICETGSAITPMYIVFTSISSSSVEANWTQPSSDSVQYYTNHTITCTSTHGVYTAVTQHINVSAAVNETMHTIITGLTANTSYNCCVSVYSEIGRSEDACGSVNTEESMSKIIQPCSATSNYTETKMILSTIVQSCSAASDIETIRAGLRTQSSVMNRPTSVPMTEAQCEASSSPIPWVAGIIIGAVLIAVILVTVIVAVYLWRKKAQSLNKMADSSTERRASLSQTNQCYSSVQEPQDYEEFQPNGQDPQPAVADGVYSYADHTVNTNVYDSVPQTNESSDCYKDANVVDNTALYSLCEQDNGEYSQLNRK